MDYLFLFCFNISKSLAHNNHIYFYVDKSDLENENYQNVIFFYEKIRIYVLKKCCILVHLGGGLWGVIACALFSTEFGILYHWDKRSGLVIVFDTLIIDIIYWAICIPIE